MATVRPLGDRVLVRRLQRDQVSKGGVVLPGMDREESDRGVVLAKGPAEIPVSEGEVVLFAPYAGVRVLVDDEEFIMLREADVLGVLEGVETETDAPFQQGDTPGLASILRGTADS